MPNAKGPPKEYCFKKGQSGNPSGKPKQDPMIRAVRECTYKEFIMALQKFGTMTEAQVKEDLSRPDVTMFEKMFGTIVAQAAKGDPASRSLLIERLWGKVKEGVDINVSQVEVTPENVAQLYEIARRA